MNTLEHLSRTNPVFSILGGGQLSQMLAMAANVHGLKVRVRVESHDDPAHHSPAECLLAENKKPLKNIIFSCTHLTFENEFINIEEIRSRVGPRAEVGPFIFPSLQAMELLQDKLGQKNLLKRLNIPAAKYEILPSKMPPDVWLNFLSQNFASHFVLKWSKYGYDGKGTFFYEAPSDEVKALEFILRGLEKGAQIFAEEKISFSNEVAMTAARSLNGQFLFFPMVFSEQKSGICTNILGPARSLGLPKQIELKAKQYMHQILDELAYCGVAAVEFFIGSRSELFINEIAPRVHNSAHFSQDACSFSQFEAHMLAPLNRLPSSLTTAPFFGMINILGPSSIDGYVRSSARSPITESPAPGLHLHWYGKLEIKPGRKLGHINFHAESANEFEKLRSRARKLETEIYSLLEQEAKELI